MIVGAEQRAAGWPERPPEADIISGGAADSSTAHQGAFMLRTSSAPAEPAPSGGGAALGSKGAGHLIHTSRGTRPASEQGASVRPLEEGGLPLRKPVCGGSEHYAQGLAELRLQDVFDDPLIALLRKADGVADRSFAQFLCSAARVLFQRDFIFSFASDRSSETGSTAMQRMSLQTMARFLSAPDAPEIVLSVTTANIGLSLARAVSDS